MRQGKTVGAAPDGHEIHAAVIARLQALAPVVVEYDRLTRAELALTDALAKLEPSAPRGGAQIEGGSS